MYLIRRKLLKEIEEHLTKREISLIIGPRQVGKTTLMKILINKLKKNGERVIYLSLDFEMDKKYFVSQQKLLQKIELEIGKEGYVFIDEIQRKEDAGLFLKALYDMELPYKFIVSGSGSLELKEKIHESLPGRKRIFELLPVSFVEFVNFKTEYKYENNIETFFQLEQENLLNLLNEYMNFGGYPRVILEKEIKEKRIVIDDIYRSYLEKDISYLLRVEKIDAFSELIKILAFQIGKIINFSEICSILNISIQTLRNYLWYAEKTFIIKRLTPYFRNIKKEISKSPVFYFYDLGLRNYVLNLLGNIEDLNQTGFLFQNFVFNILNEKLRYTGAKIHFWRTKEKAEVDFIIDYGRSVLPVEVKYKRFTKPVIGKSLHSFINKYHPEKGVIVNLNLDQKIKIKNTEIIFLPFWKLIIDDIIKNIL